VGTLSSYIFTIFLQQGKDYNGEAFLAAEIDIVLYAALPPANLFFIG